MNMPGFAAEASLYKSARHYRLAEALARSRGIMPQLFCRVTDCPCQYKACRKAGGAIVSSPQPPCYFKCELRPHG